MSPAAQLRVYRFEPDAVYEGALVGAAERMQLAGDVKLLDALFVTRDAEGGEIHAVDLASGSAGGSFAAMLDFRLDTGGTGRRRKVTDRTLAEHRGGVPRPLIEAVAEAVEPGAAILAVLLSGSAPASLDEAVERARGKLVVHDAVEAGTLAEADAELRSAVAR